jgi:hypothetical protein
MVNFEAFFRYYFLFWTMFEDSWQFYRRLRVILIDRRQSEDFQEGNHTVESNRAEWDTNVIPFRSRSSQCYVNNLLP